MLTQDFTHISSFKFTPLWGSRREIVIQLNNYLMKEINNLITYHSYIVQLHKLETINSSYFLLWMCRCNIWLDG